MIVYSVFYSQQLNSKTNSRRYVPRMMYLQFIELPHLPLHALEVGDSPVSVLAKTVPLDKIVYRTYRHNKISASFYFI